MRRAVCSAILLVAAVYTGYGAWAGLAFDVEPIVGDRVLPFIERCLQTGSAAVLAGASALGVAGLIIWRGGASWHRWLYGVLALDVLVLAVWAILLWRPETRASAYASTGLVCGLVLVQLVLGLGALLLKPGHGRSRFSAGHVGAVMVLALSATLVPSQTTWAQSSGCPDGCVSVPGTPVSVTECFLFVFCDTYTVTPFSCRDASDTEAACPADEPPPPPPPHSGEQLVFVCPGNLSSPDGNPTVVYDFTCQIIYALVDRIMKEWL